MALGADQPVLEGKAARPSVTRQCLPHIGPAALEDFPNKHVHDVGHGDFSIKPNVGHTGCCSC